MSSTFGYGQGDPWDSASEFASIAFIVRQMMAKMSTMKPVRVEAVHGNGDVAAPGTVDVLPLVNQLDGNGNATPHGVVHGVPWFRLQAGRFAIICDPQVGDIGFVVVSDRDISSVKAENGAQSNPGSYRKYDVADGIYIGGFLGTEAPTTYILFKPDGHLKIVDVSGNVLETSAAGFAITGNLTVTGSITAGQGGPDQVGLQTHLHTSANSGSPTSTPTAGT